MSSYQDVDRRRDAVISGIRNHSGSLGPRLVPYQFSGAAGTEARVQFPDATEWFQISATTSDAVKYSFELAGTAGAKHMVIAGNTSTPVIYGQVDELYILQDYSVLAKLTNIPSGSTNYSIDERA